MKKNIYKLVTLLFALSIINYSCENGSLEQPAIDLETSQDNALTERVVGDIFEVVNNGSVIGKAISSCPIIDLTISADTVVRITYPSDGCAGHDGYTRSGVIIAKLHSFNNGWIVNSKAEISFDNYKIEDKPLTGIIIARCTALEPYPVFNLTSEDMVLTFPDQKTISWMFDTNLTMLTGWTTKFQNSDDTWEINGNTEGTARNEKQFLRESIGLTTSYDCSRYFISGIINLTIGESDTYKLEFKTPCGTVLITYKGIAIQQTLQ